nr:hypothetical protein [uncultured Sphingomonas sp.]
MSILASTIASFGRDLPVRPLDMAYLSLGSSGLLDRSGGVLNSAEATIRKGRMYFIGLNPGGAIEDGDRDTYPTISESLALSRLGCNGFDQDWSTEQQSYPAGQSPMQRRFKFVCRQLGLVYSEVCATNFVFTRSRDIDSHQSFDEDLKASLKVHKILLDAVQPDFLWIQGNPETVKLNVDMEWRKEGSGYSNWSIGRGTAEVCDKTYRVCHTPHLMFWDPEANGDALRWAFEPSGIINQGS